MTTLREQTSGKYDLKKTQQLGFPVAWSGTVSEEERTVEESDLYELVDEIMQILNDPYADVTAVVVERGQIVDTVETVWDEDEIEEGARR